MYLWIKAFHIIAAISWMAGLLYLPRLYVYHAEAPPESDQAKTFAIMERRLLKIIMTPAMVITFALGGFMLSLMPSLLYEGWFLVKLVLVLILALVHGKFAKIRKIFALGENQKSPRYYKIWNEVPTILMIAIVILAVIKPPVNLM